MKHRKKLVLTAVIGSLVCAVGVIAYVLTRQSCDELQCIRLPALDSSTNREILEKTETSFRAIYTLPDARVRVEKRSKLSRSDADILTKVSVMRMQGQFETARSPYPGILSDAITCDEKFNIKPVTSKNNNQEILSFSGFLNGRMQYGSCIDGEIQYTGLNAMLYCDRQQSWYRIEVLIPSGGKADTQSYTQQLQHISCQ